MGEGDVVVSAGYEIKGDVLIIRLAPDSVGRIAEIVRAANEDTDFHPRMRLLLDLRDAARALSYEDMHLQIESLTGMGAVLAPFWALLTGRDSYGMCAANMFAVLARIENISVQVFDNEEGAFIWLRQWSH